MSTVPEVIRANSLGLRVLGLSLVSNLAAGITKEKLDHREVMAAGKKGGGKLKRLVAGVLDRLESGNDAL
jgi:purine-nucleoside phosphorylase